MAAHIIQDRILHKNLKLAVS